MRNTKISSSVLRILTAIYCAYKPKLREILSTPELTAVQLMIEQQAGYMDIAQSMRLQDYIEAKGLIQRALSKISKLSEEKND